MTGALATAHRLLTEAADTLTTATGPGATDDDMLGVLRECETMTRRLDRLTVATVSTLERRGTFTERGYKSTAGALSDLLNWERFEARRRTIAAEQIHPRTALDGTELPARLPATAAMFEAGRIGLRHVDAIAKVLASAAAGRLSPEVWAGAEAQLAERASEYTPSDLQSWGTTLIEKLDQDGPEP
ncbi:MAG: 13E12 repeat family protein, partial [Pseudonocardia sp.]|nr:13E12 repeat family protein [Pseudonocardia sp.]